MTVSPPRAGRPVSILRSAVVALFVLTILLWFWATFSDDYVPTPLGDSVAALGALAIAAITAVASVFDRRYSAGAPAQRDLEAQRSPMAAAPVRIIVVSVMMFAVAFSAIEGGVLRLWTAEVGATGDLTMTVSGYTDGGRRSGCAGLKVREAPWLMHAAVCTSYRYRQEPPPGSLLDLHGRRSPVGIQVERFVVRPGPSEAAGGS